MQNSNIYLILEPTKVFGDGPMKTIFMIEVMIKGRALYTAAAKLSDKHKNMNYQMINFYTEPTGNFNRAIYICQITDVIERWAILGKACDPNRSQKFGYKVNSLISKESS